MKIHNSKTYNLIQAVFSIKRELEKKSDPRGTELEKKFQGALILSGG